MEMQCYSDVIFQEMEEWCEDISTSKICVACAELKMDTDNNTCHMLINVAEDHGRYKEYLIDLDKYPLEMNLNGRDYPYTKEGMRDLLIDNWE